MFKEIIRVALSWNDIKSIKYKCFIGLPNLLGSLGFTSLTY